MKNNLGELEYFPEVFYIMVSCRATPALSMGIKRTYPTGLWIYTYTGEMIFRLNDIQTVKQDQSQNGSFLRSSHFWLVQRSSDKMAVYPLVGWPGVLWAEDLLYSQKTAWSQLRKQWYHTHFIYFWFSRTFIGVLVFDLHSSVFYQNKYSLKIRLLMPWKSFRSDIVPVFWISGIFFDGKYIMVSWKIGVSKFGTITKEELSYRQARSLLVPLTRRSLRCEQKPLLLLAQNSLNFETYRNQPTGELYVLTPWRMATLRGGASWGRSVWHEPWEWCIGKLVAPCRSWLARDKVDWPIFLRLRRMTPIILGRPM